MKKIIQLLFIVLLVAGCSVQNEPQITEDAGPIKLSAVLQKRVVQDNEFAFDLLKKTIEDSGETNVFVSPLSVSIALGMVWNGAAGDTKTEMETALKMSGLSADEINEYYRIMQTSLPAIDPTTKLNIANSIWYRTGFSLKPAFQNLNTEYFNSEVRELDFKQPWALDTINNWCARKTNDLIKKPLDQISSDAMMYLVNAIYFKGIWCKKFDPKSTFISQFTNEVGNQVEVNMMQQTDTFAYMEDENAQYLDLPYGNKAFSMTVILPDYQKTTADILKDLTVDKWNTILQSLTTREVEVYLPRFKTQNEFELKPVLQKMGMNLAFTDQADFSNISDIGLAISRIIHSTYIEVNEEGTEAAAVTIVGMVTSSIPLRPVILVNRPFLYIIREKSTGVILFIGKMGSVDKY
jgi:serpin B